MEIEKNKEIVRQLFARFTLTEIDQAMDLLADDAIWTVMGEPRRFAYAGPKTKAIFTGLIKGFLRSMVKFNFVPNAMTAEQDRVSVEAESFGESADGNKYHNFYHLLFVVSDGKIQAVREYLDPLEVWEFTGEMKFPT
ncbi:MAG: hypothetical protein CVU31_00350 [Betaproteobacteria bacterium HGW-Betaproteobacteria-4]|jgi:hypothetical protein|nr:MAG: hypothetical protein CVU31_00350 [Betaproteobacteria bacterium HGW-Betaproteobacteria-4]